MDANWPLKQINVSTEVFISNAILFVNQKNWALHNSINYSKYFFFYVVVFRIFCAKLFDWSLLFMHWLPTSCSLPMKHLFGKLIIDFQLYRDVKKINKIISKFMHKAISLYLTNSSWHWGPYGSLWTGMSPTKYYMDRTEVEVHILFCGW